MHNYCLVLNKYSSHIKPIKDLEFVILKKILISKEDLLYTKIQLHGYYQLYTTKIKKRKTLLIYKKIKEN